ncbi:thioredoxin family protein [Agromyces soli]
MDWTAALVAGAVLLVGTTALGLVLRARSGRVAPVSHAAITASDAVGAPGVRGDDSGVGADASALGLSAADLGRGATLVQFSTAYCSRCPGTARQLREVAAESDADEVRHVEIDLTDDAASAARFSVLQTPTTLVLDGEGRTVARIGGVPRLDELRPLLDSLTRRTRVAT